MSEKEKPVCVLSLSGGMDSGTLLAYCLNKYERVLAVGFSYGSKHNLYEQGCARRLCEHYNVEMIHIDLTTVGLHLQSNLLSSGGPIPEGHYESESMKLTVVPGRNMIFAAILAGIAESRGASVVAMGVHSGDHAIYPDCRPEFVLAMADAIQQATDKKVTLVAPFITDNKFTILRWGFEHSVPYQLTRTCYKAQPLACGKCGACQERLEAFRLHGRRDPVLYEPGVER